MHPQILFAHSSCKWTTKTCSARNHCNLASSNLHAWARSKQNATVAATVRAPATTASTPPVRTCAAPSRTTAFTGEEDEHAPVCVNHCRRETASPSLQQLQHPTCTSETRAATTSPENGSSRRHCTCAAKGGRRKEQQTLILEREYYAPRVSIW